MILLSIVIIIIYYFVLQGRPMDLPEHTADYLALLLVLFLFSYLKNWFRGPYQTSRLFWFDAGRVGIPTVS